MHNNQLTERGALILILLLCATTVRLVAQATTVYTEAWQTFKEAEDHKQKNLLAKAQREYAEVIDMLLPVHQPEAELLRIQSELNVAKIAVQLGKSDGEKLILDFVRRYQPDPIANAALLEIANYYFNENEVEKAVEYYQRVPKDLLSSEQQAEVNFRLGYANFVQKGLQRCQALFPVQQKHPGRVLLPHQLLPGHHPVLRGQLRPRRRPVQDRGKITAVR